MPKRKTEDDFVLPNLDFDPMASAARLPTDITGDYTPLSDFVKIPCNSIIEYQNKKAHDFHPWPEAEFAMLVESVRKNGVIEPVTVRITNQPGIYEMLAGEHRWKASVAAGLESIPARVLRVCSDEDAANIFSLTNLLRRENTIRDKVNGWWHYTEAIKHMKDSDIEKMVEDGIIPRTVHEKAQAGIRQVYRYARMHNLIEDLLVLTDNKKLTVASGEQLSYLTAEQQESLLPYQDRLNDAVKAKALHELAEEGGWNDTAVRSILYPEEVKKTTSLTFISSRIKTMLREKLQKSAYADMEAVVEAAVDKYLEEHPEARRAKK